MSTPADEQLQALMKLIEDRDTPLHPDLEEWMRETETLGRILQHPLVFQVPFHSPALANDVYEKKKQALAEALAAEDWHTVVYLHERPHRTDALIEFVLGDWIEPLAHLNQETRDLAASVWMDSENLHQNVEEWTELFSGWEPGQPLILGDVEEQAAFAALPEVLTVYRGDIDDGGWSWSLDPKVAAFFANRHGANAPLIQAKVAKRNVFGYLTGRAESEVLISEHAVYDIEPYEGEQ